MSAYKTEMDSIAQFVEQECSLAAEAKYPASRLYEDYRHCIPLEESSQKLMIDLEFLVRDYITSVY